MGIYIKSTDEHYNAYMNAVRDRLGVSAELLPNSKIDSYSYLQCIEEDFTSKVGADFWDKSSETTRKKIRQYLLLRTIVELKPEYPQVIREAEFGESVQYAEQSLEEWLEIINAKIRDLADEISPDLSDGTGFMAAFKVFRPGDG